MMRRLLGIKRYQFVSNAEVRWTSGQPFLTSIIQARRVALFGHIARLNDSADAKKILSVLPSEDWKTPTGRPWITWMKTVLNDLESRNLTLTEAVDVAQNCPLRYEWRYAHSYWCKPEMMMMMMMMMMMLLLYGCVRVCVLLLYGCVGVLQGVLQRELGMMWEVFNHDSVRLPLNPSLEVVGIDRKVFTS